jgi:hypothetical protein
MELPEAFLDRYYPDENLPPGDPAALAGSQERVDRVSGTYLTNRHARHTIAKLSLLSQPPVRVQAATEQRQWADGQLLGWSSESLGGDRTARLPARRLGGADRLWGGRERAHHAPVRPWPHTRCLRQSGLVPESTVPSSAARRLPPGLSDGCARLVGGSTDTPLRLQISRAGTGVRQARWLAFAVSALNVVFLVLAVTLIST